MKLLINKVHIRYEDDVFNGEYPFSCGLVIDVRLFYEFKVFIEITMGVNRLKMEI